MVLVWLLSGFYVGGNAAGVFTRYVGGGVDFVYDDVLDDNGGVCVDGVDDDDANGCVAASHGISSSVVGYVYVCADDIVVPDGNVPLCVSGGVAGYDGCYITSVVSVEPAVAGGDGVDVVV